MQPVRPMANHYATGSGWKTNQWKLVTWCPTGSLWHTKAPSEVG